MNLWPKLGTSGGPVCYSGVRRGKHTTKGVIVDGVTKEDLATTINTLHWMLAQVDSDSCEFHHIDEALLAVVAQLRERVDGTMPPKAELRELPHTEVCLHMQVAGKLMWVYPLPESPTMAQLYDLPTGLRFSLPITKGEAGLYYTSLAVA